MNIFIEKIVYDIVIRTLCTLEELKEWIYNPKIKQFNNK